MSESAHYERFVLDVAIPRRVFERSLRNVRKRPGDAPKQLLMEEAIEQCLAKDEYILVTAKKGRTT